MKNFSTWLIVIFIIAFWAFRVAVAVSSEFGQSIGGITALNSKMEIMLCFAVLVCVILIIKRSLVGSLIYLLLYGTYFGTDFCQNFMNIISGSGEVLTNSMSAFISFIGILLPIFAVADMLLDKGRKLHPTDKKTDWFYGNKEFDRQLDERADKNNYKF